MRDFLNQIPWWDNVLRILIYYVAAWFISLLLKRLANHLIVLGWLAPKGRKPRPERRKTLQSLISSAISSAAFIVATLASLGIFIQADTLFWMVGLFSAAFGLGARPLISDFLSGLSFIFEDTFAVGEKIEIPGIHVIEGLVETINLRTTMLRAPTGELYVVPNGEIRTVRNFSRGRFSIASITIVISASDLQKTIAILEVLGEEAVILLPNLIEPWQIISPKGMIGHSTELTLVAKARFAKAAEMRPKLLNLVHERLDKADIGLED
ncbi:MAG: mechanosensitive ion channel [Anaerolineaceae bacterium]|nr:mechanosensitive ion channel [Anaerolineaceae bacterium]